MIDTDRWMDRQINDRKERWMDGWIDSRDRWMGGWVD